MAWSIGLGCLAAIVLRLTLKDSIPWLAPLFYATPLVLIWSGAALSSALFFALNQNRCALATALVAVTCWGWWQQSCVLAAPPRPETTAAVPVVFWNAARLRAGWPPVAECIEKLSAPVMGFVEAGPDTPADRARWRAEFPQAEPIFFGNGMVLLVKGKIRQVTRGRLAPGCYYGRASLEIEGQELTVLVVDVHSNPFLSRQPAFQALEALVQEFSGPVLILGDFNTPAESVFFTPLRETYRNAFEESGEGHTATWPVPCPVLAIDHVWVNRQITVHWTGYAWSSESDHRPILAEVSFSD